MRNKESDEKSPLLLPRFYFFALLFTSHRSPLSERLEQAKMLLFCTLAPIVFMRKRVPPPVFETTFLPTKKKKEEEQKQVQEDKNERMKKKNIKLMKLNLNHSRGVNFKIVVFSTNSHFQGCSNVVICILKYIESSSSES